ncbi:MAG TPA: DNA methyltransferase, partial [Roseiflexaceae bacterium]|nr:DNA methyltransferase [Roseiflexaceae bacterium]
FERSLDPSKRSQLGAHYTSRDDILLIVEPVLMAPLRREWATVREGVEALRTQWDAQRGNARRKLQSVAEGMILDFMERLAGVRVLDPACGSGNFLYVALNQLKDLEKEVWAYASGVGLPQPELSVSPRQLHGIEKNQFAAELAQVVVWIGFLQWQRANGFFAVHEPILQALHTIECRDAILTVDLHGKPAEPPWPEADVIVGNPPFLGGKRLRTELGDEYVNAVFKLYDGRVPREADLVTYWFERARQYIAEGKVQRAGLLATQSVRAGANRKVLERIKQTGDIFMAWSDRPWILDGAAVRVSMVGFDGSHADAAASVQSGGPHADVAPSVETPRRGVSTTTMNDAPIADPGASVGAQHASPVQPMLNGVPVATINADLTSALDLTAARRLTENAGIAFMGDTKGGAFDISEDIAEAMLNAPLNSNGRPNSDVIRPWINGQDITDRPRNRWIIDFGTDATENEAALYKEPYEYALENIRPGRVASKSTRKEWWLHERTRPDMRSAITSLHSYIVTPRVAKHRLFVKVTAESLPDSRLFVFARDDDYFLGVLQSKIHELWSLATSSRHGVGNDPTYNNTTCFETFPFPWPPGHEPHSDPRIAAIAEAARDLVQQRDAWLAGEDDPHPGAARHPAPTGKGAGGEGEQSGVRETPEAPSSIILRPSSTRDRTLTNLYNQRPDWLTDAHRRLDRAVFAAYGWPDDLSDEAILERLLALNLERAARQGGSE